MKTLIQAVRYFSDPQVCIDTVAALRWPDGKPTCPKCGGQNHYYLAKQARWKCRSCSKQFSVKVGTIFEDSPLGLDKWLVAMWLLANCKNGISSYEVARDLGITQKSAWFMLHRIREAMGDESDKLGGKGPVEIDETFVGGKFKNMHKSKLEKGKKNSAKYENKIVIVGMLERGGRVKARVTGNREKMFLDPAVTANVKENSHIITDELTTYSHLTTKYVHESINHMEGYVRGHIHTNGIENFWALLKRSLGGTYIAVEHQHLQRYAEEQVFRFNNRKDKDDNGRFSKVLSQIAGKRLTYAELTGQTV